MDYQQVTSLILVWVVKQLSVVGCFVLSLSKQYRVAHKTCPKVCVTVTAFILYGEKFCLHICKAVCPFTNLLVLVTSLMTSLNAA